MLTQAATMRVILDDHMKVLVRWTYTDLPGDAPKEKKTRIIHSAIATLVVDGEAIIVEAGIPMSSAGLFVLADVAETRGLSEIATSLRAHGWEVLEDGGLIPRPDDAESSEPGDDAPGGSKPLDHGDDPSS